MIEHLRKMEYSEDFESLERELKLPERVRYIPWDAGTTYGVNKILNKYTGKGLLGEWPLNGFWSHGWIPSFAMVHPRQVAHLALPGQYNKLFVPREDMVLFLEKHGYSGVHSVGLPLLYLPDIAINRLPDSILVMPMHSFPDSKNRINEKGPTSYSETLKGLKERYQTVVGCIHPQCYKNREWIDDFKEANIPFVTGANMRDKNSLYRMQRLFSLFESVATNGFGSLIAYASYYGARVSIEGEFVEYKAENLMKEPIYAKDEELVHSVLSALSEKCIRRHCPFLWDGNELEISKSWAKKELGEVLPKQEAINVLGLDASARLLNFSRYLPRKATQSVSRRIERLLAT